MNNTTLAIVQPTITSSSAYAAGNCVGGLLNFNSAGLPGVAFLQRPMGLLQNIVITSKSPQSTSFKLYLFRSQPTGTYTDKAAPVATAADGPLLVGIYTLSAVDTGLGSLCNAWVLSTPSPGLGDPILAANLLTLYGVLVCTTTPTFTSTSDLNVTLKLRVD